MEFENITQYDKRAVSALVTVVTRVTQRQAYSRQRTALLTMGILVLSAGAALACVSGTLFRIAGGAAALLGGAILLEFCFLRRTTVRSIQRTLPGGPRTFRFTAEGIQAEHAGAGKEQYQYRQVAAAYDTGGCFVVLLDSGSGLMLSQDGFTEGTAEAFRHFLEEHTGKPILPLQ